MRDTCHRGRDDKGASCHRYHRCADNVSPLGTHRTACGPHMGWYYRSAHHRHSRYVRSLDANGCSVDAPLFAELVDRTVEVLRPIARKRDSVSTCSHARYVAVPWGHRISTRRDRAVWTAATPA